MALSKVTYVNGVTVITAENLNDIQEAILDLESGASITVDTELSTTSTNPVQNKVIAAALGRRIEKPDSASIGDFLCWNGTSWAATTVPSANGVSF